MAHGGLLKCVHFGLSFPFASSVSSSRRVAARPPERAPTPTQRKRVRAVPRRDARSATRVRTVSPTRCASGMSPRVRRATRTTAMRHSMRRAPAQRRIQSPLAARPLQPKLAPSFSRAPPRALASRPRGRLRTGPRVYTALNARARTARCRSAPRVERALLYRKSGTRARSLAIAAGTSSARGTPACALCQWA